MKKTGIYIHIPFCRSKCAYCDFYSLPATKYSSETVEEYVHALERQITCFIQNRAEKITVDSIYFGGGTPSLLSGCQFDMVLSLLNKSFDITRDAEITAESNPCTLSKQKLSEMKAAGLNRLSLGVQSFSDTELETIGRLHSAAQATEAFYLARECGFDNIGLDLILGLPGQTKESFFDSLEKSVSLHPEHLSVYGLSLEEDTPLYRNRDFYTFPGEEVCAGMFSDAVSRLAENGYQRYEISNFAMDGYRCRHNLHYWHGDEYLGFGVAASSYFNGVRSTARKDLRAFLKCRSSGDFDAFSVVEEVIGPEEKVREYIMLSLRLTEGLSVSKLKELTPDSGFYLGKCDNYLKSGLMRKENDRLFFTERGFEVSNSILSEILY